MLVFYYLSRFVKLQAALRQLQSKDQYKDKLGLIRNSDWILMANIVHTLQVEGSRKHCFLPIYKKKRKKKFTP